MPRTPKIEINPTWDWYPGAASRPTPPFFKRGLFYLRQQAALYFESVYRLNSAICIYYIQIAQGIVNYLDAKNIRADCTNMKLGKMYLDATYSKTISRRNANDTWFKK